jgi:hypothetical protein
MTTIGNIEAEIEQYMLDLYIHALPQQRGCTSIAAMVAMGVPMITSCGYTTWVPRPKGPDDIYCPECLALEASGVIKAVPDAEVVLLPDWWLRLTGRLPRR